MLIWHKPAYLQQPRTRPRTRPNNDRTGLAFDQREATVRTGLASRQEQTIPLGTDATAFTVLLTG